MPPESKLQTGLYDVAVSENIQPTQKRIRERAGEVMFSVGGTAALVGSLSVLVASVLRSPEWANTCGLVAAGGWLAMIPPAWNGYLPDLGDTGGEKPTTNSGN